MEGVTERVDRNGASVYIHIGPAAAFVRFSGIYIVIVHGVAKYKVWR